MHLTGWFLSPELALSREEEPLVVRILLAELAEQVDVRVLLWKGAPIPRLPPVARRRTRDGATLARTRRSSARSIAHGAARTATTRRRS